MSEDDDQKLTDLLVRVTVFAIVALIVSACAAGIWLTWMAVL